MRCSTSPKCAFRLSYKDKPEVYRCTLCEDGFLVPEVEDVLKYRMHDVVKEIRPAQLELATDIENLYKQDAGTLLAEGGTGIGKSLAYLIPTVLQKKKRVVISTPTTGLQDQLGDRDIPNLIQQLGLKNLTCGVYKGATNFGCFMLVNEVPEGPEREDYEAFLAEAKAKSHPADKKRWVGDAPRWWNNASAKNCPIPPKLCEHSAYCKPNAKSMDIVVTNHSLTGIDFMLGTKKILGDYDALVLDEGHEASRYISKAFERQITLPQLERLQTMLEDSSAAEELRNYIMSHPTVTLAECETAIKVVIKAYKGFHAEALAVANESGTVDIAMLGTGSSELRTQAVVFSKALGAVSNTLEARIEELQGKRPRRTEQVKRLTPTMSKLKRMCGTLNAVITFCDNLMLTGRKAQLVWCDNAGVYSKPRHIGPTIEGPMQEIAHKVVLSATLTFKKSFTRIKEDLGLDRVPTIDKVYKTPFDVATNTLLFTPTDVPLWYGKPGPARTAWVQKNAEHISKLARITKGRMLVLCASADDMRDLSNEMTRNNFWNTSGLKLYKQGAISAQALASFRANPRSVLFGLDSYGEGIDIPGDDLISVFIPRLPFIHPDNIDYQADKKDLGLFPAFEQKSVPYMVTKMRQWCGRLLRTMSDRGIVTISDGKIWTSTGNKDMYDRLMDGYENKDTKKWVTGYRENPDKPRREGYGRTLLDTLGYIHVTDKIEGVLKRAREWAI